MLVGHRVAAVLDDDGLAVETLDVGQGFGENGGLDAGGEVFDAHGGLRMESPRIVQRKRPERGSGLCNVRWRRLFDGQPLVRAGCTFGQGQFEDAFVEFGGRLAVVDFLAQLEGT